MQYKTSLARTSVIDRRYVEVAIESRFRQSMSTSPTLAVDICGAGRGTAPLPINHSLTSIFTIITTTFTVMIHLVANSGDDPSALHGVIRTA